MRTDRRLIGWIDLLGDLLEQPPPALPVAQISRQLRGTFRARAVSWEWRERSERAAYDSWPPVDPAHFPRPGQQHELLERHPLVQSFTTTQDPGPCLENLVEPLDWEQRLSIPYVLDGSCYKAFVLGRRGDVYDDEDLRLAGQLQRLIRGLHLRLTSVTNGPVQAVFSCASAAHIGLTATEHAVLVLLANGHTTYGIAIRLEMAPRTASKHLEHIYRKLGVTHRLAAVIAGHEAGLVPAEGPFTALQQATG